jgi:signal transduction histidine kinase
MEKIDTFIQIVEPARNKLVNTLLFSYVAIGFFPATKLLMVAVETDHLTLYDPLIVIYIVCILAALLHRWLPFHVRTGIFLGTLFVMGTIALIKSGLYGTGHSYLAACCIITVLLLGVRLGYITLLICMSTMAIVGLKMYIPGGIIDLDILEYATNPSAYATNPIVWLWRILGLGLFGLIINISLNSFYNTLLNAIKTRDRNALKLKQSREKIRDLSTHFQESIEDERKRIARELHDDLGQSLTSLRMELAALSGRLPVDHSPMSDKIGSLMERLNRTIASVKRICTELRPSVMDDLGLTAAIEWLAEDYQERTDIPIDIHTDALDIFIEDARSIATFRIAQEVLTNVVRHADATHVQIVLKLEGSDLILFVQDNGKGISNEALRKSGTFGILGIQERVSILGGDLNIQGDPETGTQIHVRLPSPKRNKS